MISFSGLQLGSAMGGVQRTLNHGRNMSKNKHGEHIKKERWMYMLSKDVGDKSNKSNK